MSAALYAGLMSGTSLDGIDAVLVDFSGAQARVIATAYAPFDASLRAELLLLQTPGHDELARASLAANALAEAYGTQVRALLRGAGVTAQAVRAIGAHGQTVRHRPDLGVTIQLNNAALLAELTGIDVIADFRSRDVAAGGQGAPIAPAFHRAYFGASGRSRIVLNIGGIANATILPETGRVFGFDTGPGNVLMDLWAMRHLGVAYDADGTFAASGRSDADLLLRLLEEPFFALPAPKSTGRDLFNAAWLDERLASHRASPANVQATLLSLTVASVANAVASAGAQEVFVCGGGAHNQTLMQHLAAALAPARVETTEALGIPADWVEAVAFAWLAQEHCAGRPIDLMGITGARANRLLGCRYPA
ncbi:MAG: anhydro-N-acetylmuramic acid kinase [Burkholderiales bacterium]|nr:anhydro-N-acetylmuramic acid kinase [Burkholderiales bacterium]